MSMQEPPFSHGELEHASIGVAHVRKMFISIQKISDSEEILISKKLVKYIDFCV